MKKLIISAIIILISSSISATRFLFETSPDWLPLCTPAIKMKSLEEMDLTKSDFIMIKVTTENKETAWGRIFACTPQPMEINVLHGDEIAELSIMKKCEKGIFTFGKQAYCEQIDEIYIAKPKPLNVQSNEKNKSKTYVENIRRYDQPELTNKRKFMIKKGEKSDKAFFNVEALD